MTTTLDNNCDNDIEEMDGDEENDNYHGRLVFKGLVQSGFLVQF